MISQAMRGKKSVCIRTHDHWQKYTRYVQRPHRPNNLAWTEHTVNAINTELNYTKLANDGALSWETIQVVTRVTQQNYWFNLILLIAVYSQTLLVKLS